MVTARELGKKNITPEERGGNCNPYIMRDQDFYKKVEVKVKFDDLTEDQKELLIRDPESLMHEYPKQIMDIRHIAGWTKVLNGKQIETGVSIKSGAIFYFSIIRFREEKNLKKFIKVVVEE